MNISICDAIQKRAEIRFYYDGGERIAEPHCHGTSRTNKEVMRAFQTGGYSTSGNPTGWKLYEVQKMSAIQETGQTFSSNRSGYNPNDEHMIAVHCHV